MQTKNYTTDLLPLIQALAGVEFAARELFKIKAMVNSRAKRAFRASNYWPRWLGVGEERAVTSGYVPWDEVGLDSVDQFLRIHRTQPYVSASAQEFDFWVDGNGANLVQGSLNSTSAFVTYKKQFDVTYGDGTSGTTLLLPDEWFEYIAHGVYSDWLRGEGQQEKAALAEQEAQEKLTDELLKVDEMGVSSLVSSRIHTHSNMQSRWSS
jgi:hypothetical protein